MAYNGNTAGIKYLNHFNYLNNFSKNQINGSQFEKLKNILIYASENVVYYKNIFSEIKFSPHSMKSFDEMRIIPLLTKEIVKKHSTELISETVTKNELREASTGGSTGVPMYFYRDLKTLYLRRGQELFFDRWMGYDLGDKLAYFVSGSHFDGRIDLLKQKIKNMTSDRIISFDPHDITDAYMAKFYDLFVSRKPKMIKCFPNALTPFAQFIKKNNLKPPPVKVISCTGENLYQQQKDLFQEIFEGEVFEKVGTRECGVIASECNKHIGLHLFTEGVFTEVINNDGESAQPGESGKLLITDLFNKAMPLIRYEIGDMAIQGEDGICECGSALPKISKYLGRDRDIISDEDGNSKPGYLFVEVIRQMNLDAQLQIRQHVDKSITVRIVKNKINLAQVNELISQYQQIVGSKIKIRIEYVSYIGRDPSGKFSYVKSDIKFNA